MTPSEPFRIETSPLAPEISSYIRLSLLLWLSFVGSGLVTRAFKLMLKCPQNLVVLTACVFLPEALLTGAWYADIRLLNSLRTGMRRQPSDVGAPLRICPSPGGTRVGSWTKR